MGNILDPSKAGDAGRAFDSFYDGLDVEGNATQAGNAVYGAFGLPTPKNVYEDGKAGGKVLYKDAVEFKDQAVEEVVTFKDQVIEFFSFVVTLVFIFGGAALLLYGGDIFISFASVAARIARNGARVNFEI